MAEAPTDPTRGVPPALRLMLDGDALVANWRLLDRLSGAAACAMVVKADGYGLGAVEVVRRLAAAGARDAFVADWTEAAALAPALPDGVALAALHGVRAADMGVAVSLPVRPVLASPEQVARWRSTGRACDVMVDTGINRLGLTPAEATSGLLDGLAIDTLHSHLACSDVPGDAMNDRQRAAFATVATAVPARRYSLANSGGVFLGEGYSHDVVRPGIALYGGVATPLQHGIAPVARIEAEVLQVRAVAAGEGVGYGATFVARRDSRIAVANLGYADGYRNSFAPGACATAAGVRCAIAGRISMDQICIDVTDAAVAAGDWLGIDLDLPALAARGVSTYEVLTGLGQRLERRWT